MPFIPQVKKAPKTWDLEKYQGDCIIPVMGATGAGKSYFINQLVGEDVAKVGHSLHSCTTRLQPVEIPAVTVKQNLASWNSNPAKRLIIVDTPGFDDTSADDSAILKRIADWLAESYGVGAKLAGVIYLHDILLTRVTGATQRNFEVFDKLCGVDACKSVVLATTKWEQVTQRMIDIASNRENDLKTMYWKDMITKGSIVQRVDDKTNASPWDVVRTVLSKGQSPVLSIQKELVDLHKRFPQTEAAQVLRGRIEEMLKSLKRTGASHEVLQELTREIAELRGKSVFARFFGRFFV